VSPRDGLVASGHVTREAHTTDRRAKLVTFTERGALTLAEMDRGHQALADLLFGDLSAAQLGGLVDGLDHVLERLREALR
jgi:DNA-binding MarR family transcriptional regulator